VLILLQAPAKHKLSNENKKEKIKQIKYELFNHLS
jgi:hypothetical protein